MVGFESLKKSGCGGVRRKPRRRPAEGLPAEGLTVVHHGGAGPDPSGDTGHAVVVENREESSGESRFGAVGTTRTPARSPARSSARPPARRSPRNSRNIAVALALLGFAVIMFLVTIVKFEEQIQKIGMSQTRGATTPARVRTSFQSLGVGALFSASDARAWGTETNPSLFGDSNGTAAASPGCALPCRRRAFQGELI